MIFKILIKNEKEYSDLLNILNNKYDFCFSGKFFYINCDKLENELKKYKAEELVNLNTISECSDFVKNWCKSIFIKQELKDFENSEQGQKRMKEIIDILDNYGKKQRKEVLSKNGKADDKDRERTGKVHNSTG